MGTFFSPTDWEQLEDRGVLCNYFIMLIVDFKGDYKAKCAFKGKRKLSVSPTIEFSNNSDGFSPFTLNEKEKEEEILVIMDMNIEYPTVNHMVPLSRDVREVMEQLSTVEEVEEDHLSILLEYLTDAVKNKIYLVDEPFRARYEAVVKAIEAEKKTTSFPLSGNNYGYGKQSSLYNDDDYGYGDYERREEKHISGKKISEMTDREFNQFEERSERSWKTEHARIVLNAAISGNRFSDKITDPIKELEKLDKKLKRKDKREEWLIGFQQEVGSAVYEMWTNEIEAEDAYTLLELCQSLLEDHKNIRLIEEAYEAIDHEMEFLEEEMKYYSNYQGGGL